MILDGKALVEKSHRDAVEHYRKMPHPPLSLPELRVHYTEFTDLPADSPIAEAWKTYRRELPRWLQEGLEGQFALVHEQELVGVFPTFVVGLQVGRERFQLQPFLVQPIQEWEPLLRTRGETTRCPAMLVIPRPRKNCLSPLAPRPARTDPLPWVGFTGFSDDG
jgi:hypothetical protein